MNLKLALKGEETKKGLELAGKQEAPSGIAEWAGGSQRLLNSPSTDLCTGCPSCCCSQVSFCVPTSTSSHNSVASKRSDSWAQHPVCSVADQLPVCMPACTPLLHTGPLLSFLSLYTSMFPLYQGIPNTLTLTSSHCLLLAFSRQG